MGPIELLRRDVMATLEVGSVPAIEGDVGVGKTRLVESIAREWNAEYHVVLGSICDPTDMTGFPTVRAHVVKAGEGLDETPVSTFAMRDWVFLIVQATRAGRRVIIFLDELTSCPPTVMAAMLTMLTDCKAGDVQLDRRLVRFVAAYNPPEVAVNGQELPAPMLTRLAHYKWPMGGAVVVEWCDNFVGYWGHPLTVGMGADVVPEACMLRARQAVSGLVRRCPDLWHYHYDADAKGAKDKKAKKADTGTADDDVAAARVTPRGWDRVSWHYGLCLHRGLDVVEGTRRYAAEVGAGPAHQFVTHVRDNDLPDPEALLANPAAYVPTGRPDLDFVTTLGVAAAVDADPTPVRYLAGWHVLDRAADPAVSGRTPAYEAGTAAATRLVRHIETAAAQKALLGGLPSTKKVAEFFAELRKYTARYVNLLAGIKDLTTRAN